jgi:hypothetical protein
MICFSQIDASLRLASLMISWNRSSVMMLRRSGAAAADADRVQWTVRSACFEHVDVNDDLGRLNHAFHRQQGAQLPA